MLFPDYIEKRVYHIVSIIDLEKMINEGIKYDDKKTYKSKYYDFHDYIDKNKTENIPTWVIRRKAIFGSLNFADNHHFHSHTALLGIKINPERCWIANENLANHTYEPFILQGIEKFKACKYYLQHQGSKILKKYWKTSLSFNENLIKRFDQEKNYDAEVLILHDILPKDIELLHVISDHNFLSIDEWKNHFCEICKSKE